MSQILVKTTAENGYWNSISGYYQESVILSSAFSSSAADWNSPFFFFHSNDATIGMPGTAIIDSVIWHYYINSITIPADYAELDWGVFVSTQGYSGALLSGATMSDYGSYDFVGQVGYTPSGVLGLTTGWNTIDISAVGGVGYNRNPALGGGYTNIQIVIINVNSAGPEYAEVSIFGDDGSHTGNISYLEINYHLPGTTSPKQFSLAPDLIRFGSEGRGKLIRGV
jgi:hypothetical protein